MDYTGNQLQIQKYQTRKNKFKQLLVSFSRGLGSLTQSLCVLGVLTLWILVYFIILFIILVYIWFLLPETCYTSCLVTLDFMFYLLSPVWYSFSVLCLFCFSLSPSVKLVCLSLPLDVFPVLF